MSSYISARLPNQSLTDLPAFLCTEFINIEKEIHPETLKACADLGFKHSRFAIKTDRTPRIMKIADALLAPVRVFTKFDNQKIDGTGIASEINREYTPGSENFVTVAAGSITGLARYINNKAILLTIPLIITLVSKATPFAKDLSSKFATWIDEKTENTTLRNISKITAASTLLLPVYFIKLTFPLVASIAKVTGSQLALGILGYLGTTFALGASLKLYAYHNDPKVKGAYNQFLTNRV